MLNQATLERILAGIPRLTLAILGDLFLDRYLDIDPRLTEPSIETGLDAYQVVGLRSYPGAAGTVINNLAALGVGRIYPLAMIGDDGEGYELRQALAALGRVDLAHVYLTGERRTPTYTKPLVLAAGQPPRELNRLDIKNRTPLPEDVEDRLLAALRDVFPRVDGLLVMDQVSEAGCGVVTSRLRQELERLGESSPDRLILADSRERAGLFRSVWLKPNQAECRAAVADPEGSLNEVTLRLARQTGRPVFCTRGEQGILVADPRPGSAHVAEVPALPVEGPIDPVGAGDSTSAGLACALACGTSLEEAAAFGNLVASVTIRQLGTTGTASPGQLRELGQRYLR